MDTEKLYDYLQQAGKPMSIGEINADPQFKGVPRRELAAALQQLASEDIAFRSVKEGKAYYSANAADGVSKNPCQKNIANIAAAMNGAFAGLANPEMKKAGEAFRALDQLLGVDDSMRGEMPKLTYTQGTIAKCKDYTVAIPDGFILEMGRDDRDFVAWLPEEGGSQELEDARITLFAGQLNATSAEGMAAHLKTPELMAAIIKRVQWAMKTKTDRLLGVSEMGEIPVVGQVGGSYLYHDSNYQIMLGMPQGCKQMRMLVTIPGVKQEDYHQAVVDWVATIRSDKPFAVPEELNSEKYLPLTEKNLKAWCDASNRTVEYLNTLKNTKVLACADGFTYQKEMTGTVSITLAKKEMRTILEAEMPKSEAACESAIAFVKRACAAEPTNRNLLKLQEAALEMQDILKTDVNLDDASFKVESPKRAALKKALALPEIAAIKQQIQREEEERKERERKEKLYKSAINDLSSNKESVLIKTAETLKGLGDFKEAPKKLEECNAKLEEIRKEKERKRLEAERAAEEKRRREEEERLRREEEERQRKLAEEERKRARKAKFKKMLIRTGIAVGLVVVLYLATLIVPAILRSNGTMMPEFSAENLTQMQADTKAAIDDYGRLGSKEFKAARVMLTDDLKEQLRGHVDVKHWDLSAVRSVVVFYVGPESETTPDKGFFDQWKLFGDEPITITVEEDWAVAVALLDDTDNVIYNFTGGSAESSASVDSSISDNDLDKLRKEVAKEELSKEDYAAKYAEQLGDFVTVVETKLAANPDYLYTLECLEDCNAPERMAKNCKEYAEKCRTVQRLRTRLTTLSAPNVAANAEQLLKNVENLQSRKVIVLTNLQTVNAKLATLNQINAVDLTDYLAVVNAVSQEANYLFKEEVLRASRVNSAAANYDAYLRDQKQYMMELTAIDQAMKLTDINEINHLLDKNAIEIKGFGDYSKVLISYIAAVVNQEQFETMRAADLTAYETESAAAKQAAGANFEKDITYMKVQMKYEDMLKEYDQLKAAVDRAKTKVSDTAADIERDLNDEAQEEEDRLIRLAIQAEQKAVREYLTREDHPMDSEYKVVMNQWGVLHEDYAAYIN